MKPISLVRFPLLLAATLSLIVVSAQAQIDWPQLKLTQVASNLIAPLHINNAQDGSGRLFIVEQPGRIKILQSNAILPQPLLDITDRTYSPPGQIYGLLSVAFPSNYTSKGCFYVYYTRTNDHASVISRFFLTSSNVANRASEQVLITITNTGCPHLLGGMVRFGPDGFLYITTGSDEECEVETLAQLPSSFWGKILRIDVESTTNSYVVPASNPFVGNPAYKPEIWALGLRNPWRLTFDRLTGDMYLGDVGQDGWEEVDFQPAGSAGGQNYGWDLREGNHDLYPGDTSTLTGPVAEYPHTNGVSSITGGCVYRGTNNARMQGLYFFGDFYSGGFWELARVGTNWQMQLIPIPKRFLSTFGEDEAGELYLADLVFGKIYKIDDSGLTGPPVFSQGSGIIATDVIVITSSSPGAAIHFTTNGITPQESDPLVPTNGLLTITTGTTLSARAFRADLLPSTVTTATYILQVGKPVFTPPHGPITNGTLLAMTSSTTGAVIRYTLNGSDPNPLSTAYSGPFAILATNTVSAQAYKTGFSNSIIQRVYFNGATRINPAQILSGNIYFNWPSEIGRTYQLQVSTNLVNWSDIGSPQSGTGEVLAYNAPVAGGAHFYRLRSY